MTLWDERTWSLYLIVRRSGQVRTSQNRWEVLFFLNGESHALQTWPTPQTCVQFSNRTSIETLWPYQVVETVLCHASIGVRCERVWGPTFLRRTSKIDTPLESSRLAELKYAIFSRTGHKTKKLQCSKLFLSTVFKHGLLEGSTFLFQYSSMTVRHWKAVD